MSELINKISNFKVVPVIKIDNAADAVPLAGALRAGGLNCAEITFRTAAAEQAIKNIHAEFPDMLIIAGTVLTAEQADKAMAAGASAIVSPGLNPALVKHCQSKSYDVIPGVCTPSEIEKALSLGLTHLKFFPAEAAGGVAMIKALSAPYGMVKFMPTGGISPANIASYLGCKAIFACGGSWMVPADKIAAGKFDEIVDMTKEAVNLVKSL